ncbi:hypothetical protein HMPREF9946_02238 [Acetobacteraceae bacterium AT-5844]|nr:hypothetical protein HMPREF9946_02238 [Acetobacteraceae bacterium AT-5844]
MTTAARAAAQGEVVTRVVAVDLDFPSGHVRLNGSPVSVWIGGNEFHGVGQLGGISAVEESVDLAAYGLTLQLSGIPRDAMVASLAEDYQGRAGIAWEVLLDNTSWQPISEPLLMFRGRMDQMNARLGTEAAVEVKLENRLRDWERPRIRRYTSEDQRRIWPTDLGFEFVPATVEKELIWPAKSFRG